MRINFVSTPRLSSGAVRRILARQSLLLIASILGCVLTGTLISTSHRVWMTMKSPFDTVTGDSVSRCWEELKKLQQGVSLLRSAKASRTEPDRVMGAIGRSLPDGVWIVSVRDRARHVEIEGRATTERDIQTFMARLEKEEGVRHVAVVSSQSSSHDVDSLEFRLVADYEASP